MNRRTFLVNLLAFLGISQISFSIFAQAKTDLPKGMNAVPASDGVAKALGYAADPSKIDFKRFPQREMKEAQNQACENCNFYKKNNANWGQCQLISSGLVASKGWCGSWVKKG